MGSAAHKAVPAERYQEGGLEAGPDASGPPCLMSDELRAELGGREFPFANIALEGGGSKGMSLIGCTLVLEELGYWEKLRRFAGASAGSTVAALVAIGYSSHDIEEFLSSDIQNVLFDASFGFLSLLPNMLRKFGWHPGQKMCKWFGDKVEAKTGNADLTFQQLFDEYDRELCITVANLNTMDCTYCHVKTTPDLPIRKAVQMSCAIPGVFCPVKVTSADSGITEYYVDGGLLCNYPIHCFDGWYLSMKNEHSFFEQLRVHKDNADIWDARLRFRPSNEETLGILMYSAEENEVMKSDLEKRLDNRIKPSEIMEEPKTKMAKRRRKESEGRRAQQAEFRRIDEAINKLKDALLDSNADHDPAISLQEFLNAMNQIDSKLPVEERKLIFGEKFDDPEAMFKELDASGDGEISFSELVAFGKKRGVNLMGSFVGYKRQEIQSLGSYFGTLMETLLLNMKKIFVKSEDVNRTIGIDTKYIDTLDFNMAPEDQQYLIHQGKLGCIAFLRERIAEGKMPRLNENGVGAR